MTPFDFEESNGKPRITRARRSDLTDGAEAGRPPQRDAKGQFQPGNEGGAGWGWKNALATTLPNTPEARRMYRGALRQLSHDTPFARGACIRWVRCSLREAELDAAAVKAGIQTDSGRALLDLARQLGIEAERAATAALTYTKRKSPSKSAKAENAPSVVASMRAAVAENMHASKEGTQ